MVEQRELERRIVRLEEVCAEACQVARAVGAPERVLDNLCAAAEGRPPPHATFLPIAAVECRGFFWSSGERVTRAVFGLMGEASEISFAASESIRRQMRPRGVYGVLYGLFLVVSFYGVVGTGQWLLAAIEWRASRGRGFGGRVRRREQRVVVLEQVVAEAYQLAVAIGAPERVLDTLWAAAQGKQIPGGSFVPVSVADCNPEV